MKKIFLLLCVAVALVSCTGNSPKDTAKKFTESIAKGDIEEAKKYTTAGTASILDMANQMGGDTAPKFPDFKFEMISDSIVGDSLAWVTYTSPQGNIEDLSLVKENGQWKVTMGK